jgi:hypothetical protein
VYLRKIKVTGDKIKRSLPDLSPTSSLGKTAIGKNAKCRQRIVETPLLRADRGETAVQLNVIQKKWGGFSISSLADC